MIFQVIFPLEILWADWVSEFTSGTSLNMPIQLKFKFESFIPYITGKQGIKSFFT